MPCLPPIREDGLMAWQYDEASHRYRDVATGRYLSPTASLSLRDDFQDRQRATLTRLADRLASQDMSVQQWEAAMRTAVRQIHSVEYAYGRGGVNAMTAADDLALRSLVADQWAYLHTFAESARAGLLTPAQIAARAQQYAASSRQSYERGHAAAWGVDLPAYPGQNTVCKASCRCSWSITETADEFRCTWVRHASDSCSTCLSRAAQWAPLVISKPNDGRIAHLWRVA